MDRSDSNPSHFHQDTPGGTWMPMDQRFPKAHRLLRGAEFARVYQRRQSAADDVLIVHACENDLDHARLGLSVSRKVGPATVRNRWKRLMREAFRRSRDELPSGIDLIAAPRRGTEPTLPSVTRSLCRLAAKLAGKLRPADS